MSFLQEKRETRFAGKLVTTNQPRTAEWRERLSTTTEIAAPSAAFGYFRFSPNSTCRLMRPGRRTSIAHLALPDMRDVVASSPSVSSNVTAGSPDIADHPPLDLGLLPHNVRDGRWMIFRSRHGRQLKSRSFASS